MRKLKIDRAIWLRGEGPDKSKLFRTSDRKKCCVGIYLLACGMDESELADISDASNHQLRGVLPEEARWLNRVDPPLPTAGVLYEANDYKICTDAYCEEPIDDHLFHSENEREAKIKEYFLAHDVEVEFI